MTTEVLTDAQIKTDKFRLSVQRIITGEARFYRDGVPSDFDSFYRGITNYPDKYALAVALIEDGRFKNPRLLYQQFIYHGDEVDPKVQVDPEEAKDLQDKLRLLVTATLVQIGTIKEDSPEAQTAEAETLKFVDQNEQLRQLRGILPIHIMGAITNVTLFADMTDEQKREKLRSWTTRALLRPYLGDLETQRPLGEIDFKDLALLIPEEIFRSRDSVVSNLIRNYFTSQAMQLFVDGEETGFIKLQETIDQEASDVKRQVFEQIYREFEQVKDVQIPARFNPTVPGWFTETSPMPLFRQKYFIHEFLKTGRKLLNGDTGATKTACAYLAMETAGARRVTIIGPARARNTWPREAEKIFIEASKPDVFAVRSASDLENPHMESAAYVYIGSELLSKAWNDITLRERIKTAFNKRQTDGVILDESDEFKNKDAQGSKMLVDLITKMKSDVPIVALTATPISSSLEDLDITMALLYPDRFAIPQKNDGKKKNTFSVQALRDPNIAFSLLHGEKLMIQWTLEDLFGDKAPKLEYRRMPTPMRPSQQIIYEYVERLALGPLTKIRLLRSVLLNPELIKRVIKKEGHIPEPVYSQDELVGKLYELYGAYLNWVGEKDPAIPDELFSADWIAKYGERDLILQCFFDESLIDGIESFVQQHPDLAKNWQEPKALSGKYIALREFLESRMTRNEGNNTAREKTFIVSPYHKQGITRWLEDPQIKDSDLADNAWSLYEYIRSEWLPGLPRDLAINLDGTRSFTFRDREAMFWRESGDRNLIVVASMQAVYESMDWAIRDNSSTKDIDKMNVIFLGWPFGWDEFKQMTGRFLRPGQVKPVDILVYESEGTIDQGLFDLVRKKNLLIQMSLAGIELSKDDQEFFRRSTLAKRILLVDPTTGQNFLQSVVRRLRGAGESQTEGELSKKKDDKSYFELFAEFYFDEGRDEFRIVGNNAELVKNIVLRTKPRRILSVGAGSCLLARKMTVQSGYLGEIDNIDINEAVLRLAKERFPDIGHIIKRRASNLELPAESYDAVDYSFILPWTKLLNEDKNQNSHAPHELERVKVLLEMNRVLKTGGTAVLSFPESSFDTQTFAQFTKALEDHFGFTVINPSGMSYATEVKPQRRIGWVITAVKRDNPSLSSINSHDLMFLTDERVVVSKYKGGRDTKSVVISVDYPIFSSKRFEVYNPLTDETLSADSPTLEEDLYQSPRNRVNQLKDIMDDMQRERWNLLRRRIEKDLQRRYDDAEDLLAGIIFRRGLQGLPVWDERIEKILHADINRLLRNR